MNILILSWRGPGHPLSGGAEQVTWHHAAAWVKAGHHVTLFTSSYIGSVRSEIKDGVQVIRYGWQFIGVQLAAFFWYCFSSHPRFDLVVDEFHGLPFFTPIYVKTKKLAYIHEVAQAVWALNPWPKPYNLIPAVLGKLIEPYIFKIFYRRLPFMTVSQSTKSDLQKWGINDITIIPNGLTLPKILPSAKKETNPTFIFLSALAKDKGIEDAISSFRLIYSQIPNSKFWIVGKGDSFYLNTLKQMSQGLPVKYWGFVSEKIKFELLAKAHLLLFPSVHEGWGLVVIEANSVGTPAVVYPSSGLVDSTQDGVTGVICRDKTPQSLANSAISLYQSNNYSKISRAAVSWSRRFLWATSSTLSLRLISSIFQN